MAIAIALSSRTIAEELYEVLRELDPAAWKDEVEEAIRERLQRVQARIQHLLEATDTAMSTPAVIQLRQRMREISAYIDQHMPDTTVPVEQLREAWDEFRLAIVPRYEAFGASLRALDIHVPSLRPTNYKRNIFHVLNGLVAIGMLMVIRDMTIMLYLAGSFAGTAWTLESTRRLSDRWNGILMKIFGPFAHPHEHWRVNSATWFCTALLALALFQDARIGALGLVVLSFADPMAAIIGRRWGRVRLVNGRSLEGSLTFVGVAVVASMLLLSLFWPDLSWQARWVLASSAAFGGALSELFARRIDDNLAVPVGTAAAALAATTLLGL